MNFCDNIQSSIIRIKIGSSQTQKARKKVNFIRYIRKADDDSISVAERQKLSPFIIRKARSFFLALTPFTRRAKKVSFFTFRLDLDDVKIEFVLEFRNMGVWGLKLKNCKKKVGEQFLVLFSLDCQSYLSFSRWLKITENVSYYLTHPTIVPKLTSPTSPIFNVLKFTSPNFNFMRLF